MEITALKSIPSSYAIIKRALIVCLAVCIVTIVGCLFWTYKLGAEFRNSAFILSETGSAAFAKGVDENGIDKYRRPEIRNHAKVFHDGFWTIDQFSFERKINNALYLIGESGKQMYLTLKAQGHYANLESQNLSQTLNIDSIQVVDNKIPYEVAVFGKLIVKRTDQRSRTINDFVSHCNVYNVARTAENPHGLLIENYRVKTSGLKK